MDNRNRKMTIDYLRDSVKRYSIFVLSWFITNSVWAQMHNYDTNFEYSLHHFVDTIPIEIEKNQIFVWVEINGKQHRFNIDTGSSQGVVYQDSHLDNHIELGRVVSRDAAGNRDTVRVIQLPPMKIGRLGITNYVASVFTRHRSHQNYDAILGFDLLNKGLCCKIDARQKHIILTDRRDFFDQEPGYGIRYKLKWFVPYLLVSPFKRHVDEVLFDTGSRHLYTMNKQSFDQHAYKSKNVESQVESRAHGSFAIGHLGAERTDEVAFLNLDRLKWDEFSFNRVRAITTQGASRIGAQILDYGTITINGFRRKITFQPYQGIDSVEVNNPLPRIAYIPRFGRPVIGLILEDCNEYRAGLRQGDMILAINRKSVDSFDEFVNYPFVEDRVYLILVKTKDGRNKEVTLTYQSRTTTP